MTEKIKIPKRVVRKVKKSGLVKLKVKWFSVDTMKRTFDILESLCFRCVTSFIRS